MSSSKAPLAFIIAVTVALAAALAFESVYDVSFRVRPPDPLDIAAAQPSYAAMPPLALRLVDSGGVGIPLEAWASDYSHDRRVFRRVILEGPPYIDAAEFARVERDWRPERAEEGGASNTCSAAVSPAIQHPWAASPLAVSISSTYAVPVPNTRLQ